MHDGEQQRIESNRGIESNRIGSDRIGSDRIEWQWLASWMITDLRVTCGCVVVFGV